MKRMINNFSLKICGKSFRAGVRGDTNLGADYAEKEMFLMMS